MKKKFLLLLFFGLAIITSLPRIVRVHDVTCFSQYGEGSETLGQEISKQKGESYFSAKKNIRNYLDRHILVKEYTISFKLPPKFAVSVLLEKPKFTIAKNDEKSVASISEEGIVLQMVETSSLPRLIIEGSLPSVGEKVSQEILFSLNIVRNLTSSFKLRQSHMEGDKLVIELMTGPTVIFPVEGDGDLLLGSFVLIANELEKIDSEKENSDSSKSIVDLRYKNPVIK